MIKDRLSEFVKLEYESGYPQPSGFMNYPQQSDDKYDFKYFDQYESEHRKPILNSTGIEIAFGRKKGNNQKITFGTFSLWNGFKGYICKDYCKTNRGSL